MWRWCARRSITRSKCNPRISWHFIARLPTGLPLPVMIYSVPPFTGYDIPVELVIELADHPNIIGMKESGGDVEKVRRMVEGTRHVKRSATVTETFDAVTPRMLKAASHDNGQGRELVPVGALAGLRRRWTNPVRPVCTGIIRLLLA